MKLRRNNTEIVRGRPVRRPPFKLSRIKLKLNYDNSGPDKGNNLQNSGE